MTPRTYFGVRVYWPAWPMALIQIPLLPLLFAITTNTPWWNIGLASALFAICAAGEIWARRHYVTHPPELELVNDCLIVRVVENSRIFEGSGWSPGWAVVGRRTANARWFESRADALKFASTKQPVSLAAEATA